MSVWMLLVGIAAAQQDGHGSCEDAGTWFRDVTESAGVRGFGNSLGVNLNDFDGDGDQDLYVANHGFEDLVIGLSDPQANALYRNMLKETGTATFEDVAGPAGGLEHLQGAGRVAVVAGQRIVDRPGHRSERAEMHDARRTLADAVERFGIADITLYQLGCDAVEVGHPAVRQVVEGDDLGHRFVHREEPTEVGADEPRAARDHDLHSAKGSFHIPQEPQEQCLGPICSASWAQ